MLQFCSQQTVATLLLITQIWCVRSPVFLRFAFFSLYYFFLQNFIPFAMPDFVINWIFSKCVLFSLCIVCSLSNLYNYTVHYVIFFSAPVAGYARNSMKWHTKDDKIVLFCSLDFYWINKQYVRTNSMSCILFDSCFN